jgi:hypothetical protein
MWHKLRRNHYKDQDVGGWIILRWILERMGWSGLVWSGLAQNGDKQRVLVNALMNLWVP